MKEQTMAMMRRMVVAGVGLIGGSLALDVKRLGLADCVAGVDADAANLREALRLGVVDEGFASLRQAVGADTDCVLLAVPVGAVGRVSAELAPLLPEGCVVSDVGSTKQSVLAAWRENLPEAWPRCVAAHPVAGSARSGAAAAQAGLFAGKRLILCPHEAQDAVALARVEALWRAVGAQVGRMDAVAHDAAFAAVSHLPQLLAYAYMRQIALAAEAEEWLRLAGSGFRDFSRLAGSEPTMWADIALANRENLLALLAGQERQLAQLRECLAREDGAGLREMFAEASAARREWESGKD
ncbi:prephenate dehydrogenase [Eikenella longinqua]|nr:prephenate dehydrogenase/arogenate dehydrogenase family protein [Eikenella longinqua]